MKRYIYLCIIFVLSVSLIAGCAKVNNEPAPIPAEQISDLEILFINVGKADSALVSFHDHHYLIDTGSENSFPALVRALRAKGVEKLDAIFLTHTHDDHIGGLEGLLQLFPVEKIYAAKITTNKKKGGNVMDEKAQKHGYTVHRLNSGDEIVLDPEFEQVKFNVVGPITFNAEDDNDNSLVMYLEAGPLSCLFTGDMQVAEEKTLLDAKLIKPSELLKVGNHGNPDASSHAFISTVSPKYAIISTDSRKDTDTPAPSVLSELRNVNSKVFVTQDAKTGIQAKMESGQAVVDYINLDGPQPASGITITSIDNEAERIVLRNNSDQAIPLSGWWILSERGGEMFFFPKDAVIQPNGEISIASGKNPPPADFLWDDNNVWHNSKSDAAIIYDSMGNEVYRKEIN